MKPPHRSGPEGGDDRRHVQLGRIVRKGLEPTYDGPAESQTAERLYRQANRYGRQPGQRLWPMVLAGFGATCATAALLLVLWGPSADRSLVWSSSSSARSAVGSAEVIHFSDGSVVTFRKGAWGRVIGSSSRGAEIELSEGRASFRILPRHGADWKVQAGPYTIEATGNEFEAAWTPKNQILTLGLASGKVVVRGPGAEAGQPLAAGESLVARSRDGLVTVGSGGSLMAALSRDEAGDGAGDALVVPESGESERPTGAEAPALALISRGPAPDDNGVCPQPESTGGSVPDPGPVSLLTCRHVDPGATGKDVPARQGGEPWVRPGTGGCLAYHEDTRGNRIPDFSYAGYRGGGVSLPVVAAPSDVVPLAPGASGDDTPAIQSAIDAVSALPINAQGFRGAVELGPGIFTLKGSVRILKSGVVLRGSGTEGTGATVLVGVGPARELIRLGAMGRRRLGRSAHPITDVYVPVGARSFTLERVGNLRVGDEIVIYRPKTQRWICAIGTDVMPARADGRANPPWRPSGSLTFERRVTKIEGHRITVDAPLTNALEKEFTQAFVTEMDFPERIAEVGVENLAGRGEFTPVASCAPARGRLVRADNIQGGWIRNVRADGFGGELASVGTGTRFMTVEDVTYVASENERCPGPIAFTIGGQQNLFLRARAFGTHVVALGTETEVEGPNAVVDLVGIGRDARVSAQPRWNTGLLLDNVRLQDPTGLPAGEIDLGRARSTFGWPAANTVLWNSDAESVVVDSPPTAHNWIMGGARGARSLAGTGIFSGQRTTLSPQSLYRAQLVERLGRSALLALGRSPMGTLPGLLLPGQESGAVGPGFGNPSVGSPGPASIR